MYIYEASFAVATMSFTRLGKQMVETKIDFINEFIESD